MTNFENVFQKKNIFVHIYSILILRLKRGQIITIHQSLQQITDQTLRAVVSNNRLPTCCWAEMKLKKSYMSYKGYPEIVEPCDSATNLRSEKNSDAPGLLGEFCTSKNFRLTFHSGEN